MLVNCFFALVSALQGGAAVSAAPTELWATARLVHCKGVQLSQLGFAACQSKNCTNRAVGLLIGWCTARGCSCLSCTNRAVGLLIGWCT